MEETNNDLLVTFKIPFNIKNNNLVVSDNINIANIQNSNNIEEIPINEQKNEEENEQKNEEKNEEDKNKEDKNKEDKNKNNPYYMDYNDGTEVNKRRKKNRKKLKKIKNNEIEIKYENFLNEYFDQIYVINMPSDIQKRTNIKKQLDEFKIKFKFMRGIDVKNDINYKRYLNRWYYQKGVISSINKNIFDENIYLRKNKDLNLNIKNRIQAWSHYKSHGIMEQRKLYEKSEIKNTSQLGCLLAHLEILTDAIESNYKRILILEDDVYLHKDFNNLFKAKVTDIANWKILYLGACQKRWNNIKIMENFYLSNNTFGGFSYGIDSSVFNILRIMLLEFILPVDECLKNMQKIFKQKCYVIYPNLIISDLENSRIHRKRLMEKYSKVFKWDLNNYKLNL